MRQAMASDESGPAALSARFRTLGVVPYVGVAAKISSSSSSNTTASSCALFRKVPLRSSTGLPVRSEDREYSHITSLEKSHWAYYFPTPTFQQVPCDGDFLLNSSQEIITGSNVSDKSDVIQAAWNNILLSSLSKEYVLLLCSVKTRFVKNPELFYTLWPRYGKICEAMKKSCINDKFYAQICSRPRAMFLSRTNDTLDFRALDSAYVVFSRF